VSPVVAPSFLTFLSTPFFAAVPMVMRRSPLGGRCLMLAAGIGNTVLCRHAFGPGSGVEVFLFPCLVLALLLFRRSERVFAFTSRRSSTWPISCPPRFSVLRRIFMRRLNTRRCSASIS